MKDSYGKPVVRVIRLDETSWKWLSGWLETLLRTIQFDDMNPDTLRLGGILQDVKKAEREDQPHA